LLAYSAPSHMEGNRDGWDDGGQGVAVDELQHQRTQGGRPYLAQHARTIGQFGARVAKSSADCPDTSPDRAPAGVAGCRCH